MQSQRHIIRRISVQSYFACGAGKQARITGGGESGSMPARDFFCVMSQLLTLCTTQSCQDTIRGDGGIETGLWRGFPRFFPPV